jgi:hypothetical protein
LDERSARGSSVEPCNLAAPLGARKTSHVATEKIMHIREIETKAFKNMVGRRIRPTIPGGKDPVD